MKRLLILPLIATILLWTVMPAHAVTFGFENITGNSFADAAIGESQLFVDVTDPGGGQVLFAFSNTGSAASSITQVYFDDGSLWGIASIDNSDPGVSFSQLASPPNLPGANNATPPFVTTTGFSAGSDPPVQPNGVNPGEWLGVLFNLQTSSTFADTIADLNDRDLRIGIHVQGFASGGSESFVNTPASVPEPATFMLLGSGLAGLVFLKRRKSAKGMDS